MNKDKIAQWRKLIAEKKSSGLKLDDWCSQNQLSRHAYYYWKRIINELDDSLSNTVADKKLFVEIPVNTKKSTDSSQGMLLIEWNDVSIKVTDNESVTLAAELIARLHKTC